MAYKFKPSGFSKPSSNKPPADIRYRMRPVVKTAKAKKMAKVMGEFKKGNLHTGSKTGPVVRGRKQAIAIGLSQAKKAMDKLRGN